MTGSFSCLKGQLFPFAHPAGVVYGTRCFLILPGSLFSVRTAEFPPPVFAGAGLAEGDGVVVEEEACFGLRLSFPGLPGSLFLPSFAKIPSVVHYSE